MKKAQRVGAPDEESQQQIVPGSSRRAAPGFAAALGHCARQRRLLFVKSQARHNNRIVSSLDARNEARLQVKAALPREVCGVTGAAQQALHLARPILLLDFDERLQFAKVMRVIQRRFKFEVQLPAIC